MSTPFLVNEAFKIKNIYIFNILKLFSSNNRLEKQHKKALPIFDYQIVFKGG